MATIEFVDQAAHTIAGVGVFLSLARKKRLTGVDMFGCVNYILKRIWAAFAVRDGREKKFTSETIEVSNRKGVINGRMEPLHQQNDT